MVQEFDKIFADYFRNLSNYEDGLVVLDLDSSMLELVDPNAKKMFDRFWSLDEDE